MTPRTHKRTRKVAWTVAATAAASALTGIGWVHAYAEDPGNVHAQVCARDSVIKGIQVSGTDPEGRTITTPAADVDGIKKETCGDFGEWRIGTTISVRFTSSNPPVTGSDSDGSLIGGTSYLLDPVTTKDGGIFQFRFDLSDGCC